MLWPTLGSAAFVGAIAASLWRRRADTKGAFTLALLALLLVAWCLAGAAESAATHFATQRGWFVMRDALTMPGVVLAFWFAIQYAGLERWVTRPVTGVLVGVVIVHIALEYVDGGHLLWSGIVWDREIQGERTELGLAFAAFALGMFLLSTAVFLLLFVRSPAHRVPVALILVGQVVMRVVYPIGVFNFVYVPNIVLGVVGFDAVAFMYALALFRFRLFDLVPVARQTILQRIPDAMLVLDMQGRVADLNAAAGRLLGMPSVRFAGTPLISLPDNVRHVAAMALSLEHPFEVVLHLDQGQRICQLAVTELADWQKVPIGRLVLIHDITELRAAEDRLLERERALTASRERERLARDLHDSVGQVLGYLGLQASAIRKLASDGRLNEVDERLDRFASIAVDAQSDVRRTIAELSHSASSDGDFLTLLQRRLDAARRDYGIAVSLAIASSIGDIEPPSDVAAHLLRIVDEAVTNAIRHGEAGATRVSLERGDSSLVLSIEDDGVGFDMAAVSGGGNGRYGLRFMRARAAELGGDLEIASAPGHGTRVTARVPLDRADRKAADR
jgi:PAS domain S-box-containing protein